MQRLARMYQRVVVEANKPQPLQLSEQLAFTIQTTLATTTGKIGSIRVQDIARNMWYEWDISDRRWYERYDLEETRTPVSGPRVTPGSNLYIGLWVINQGQDGNLTLTIIDDAGVTLAVQTFWCPYWNNNINIGVGIETGTKTMPSRPYGITVGVSP